MMAINSYGTGGQQEFEVVYVGSGRNLNLDQDLNGQGGFCRRQRRLTLQDSG